LTLVDYGQGEALRDAWSAQLDAIQPALERDPGACDAGAPGVRRWGFGRLACSVEDGLATIAWTDTRSHLLGRVQGPDADIGSLYTWWQQEAKPLGRASASRSPAAPGADRPLVRVPGRPNDVICTSLAEPIVDRHDRVWEIERVRFRNEPDFERVVLLLRQLERNGRGAEVTVDRMPVADVATEVPGAQRPGRGRTALVVRMPGVIGAPDLRGYRPEGLDQVRELSIIPGRRSRTAVISLNGDACYQVRVPVFGASATGNEDRAEVFIDVPG
jgi:hypothetical protein